MKTNINFIQKPVVTLTVTFTEAEINALAGESDWLWNVAFGDSDERDRAIAVRPAEVDELYWTLRDAYNDHLKAKS